MASADGALEAALAAKVRSYLDASVYGTARFLAERVVAHNRSEENLLLLATCYVRSGQRSRAIAVLDGSRRLENRYLLALCCLEQGKLVEAEDALLDRAGGPLDSGISEPGAPLDAAGLYLMGRICRRANRRQQAIDYFVKSLEMDNFLWSAYEELCDLGANVEASRFFGASTYFADDEPASNNCWTPYEETDRHADPSDPDRSPKGSYSTPRPQSLVEAVDSTLPKTASSKPPQHLAFKTPSDSYSNPSEGVKKPRVAGTSLNVLGAPNNKQHKAFRRPLADSDEKTWRHGRLSFSSTFSDDSPQQNSNVDSTKSPAASRILWREGSTFDGSADQRPDTRHISSWQGEQELLRLLSSFGSIYQQISAYMCHEALEMISYLPPKQRKSGWVRQQAGRAHFEMADYQMAHDVYRDMFRAEPHRMEGLDLYSTTLWHLKKEVELSYLAQQVTDFDRLSHEAWCVAGNCFSLQKEHDTALAFFQRAIQLDPSYTYAYTLSGHEYVSNEDFDKAINCYRHAIRLDARHYNAWYGLGTIYYRQEKFEFAEYHFQRALEINPQSSLLHCFLGMVLHAMHRYDEALDALSVASELQPLNPQARFQRANVLITQQRFDEALGELRAVRDFAPRESSVHFMMGKVAKKLGRLEDALRYFTTALYFHPKDNNLIRSAIDKINEPEFDDDERL